MGISSPELAWLFPRPLPSLLCCPWCLVSGCWDSSLHPESKATGNQAPRPTQPFCLQIHCLPPSARNARELEAGQIAFPIILGFCYQITERGMIRWASNSPGPEPCSFPAATGKPLFLEGRAGQSSVDIFSLNSFLQLQKLAILNLISYC